MRERYANADAPCEGAGTTVLDERAPKRRESSCVHAHDPVVAHLVRLLLTREAQRCPDMKEEAVSNSDPGVAPVTRPNGALVGGRWAWLAASLLGTAGAWNIVWGAEAIAGERRFTPDELLLSEMGEQAWGALSLGWGLALVAAALLVYTRRRAGVLLGTALAASNAVVQLLAIRDFPGWVIAAIAVDLLLIYALRRAARAAAFQPG